MASRMERLHEKEERSTKNEHIYRKLDEYQINEMGSYTNIEGVAKLKGNEVDIEMVKKLIKSSKSKPSSNKKKKEEKKESEVVIEEEQNYDIKEVLDKAKEDLPVDDNKYRNLKNYELLKQIKVTSEEEKEELKEIINTMTLESLPDDLGIFDDLKSNTMVKDSESIKKIIEEAKEEIAEEDTPEIDKSFYTASFNISNEELNDFKNIGLDIKKNNKLIKILITISSIILAIIILVVVAKTIF